MTSWSDTQRRDEARRHLDELRTVTRPPAPPEPPKPMAVTAAELEVLRDRIDHARTLGVDIPLTTDQLERIIDRIDELESAEDAADFLAQVPDTTEGWRLVCHPDWHVAHTNHFANGTAVVTIKKRKIR